MITLDNLQPFNSCFYYNCTYSCLFSIITANEGDIRKIMISGLLTFDLTSFEEGLYMQFDFLESYKDLLGEQGISAEKIHTMETKECVDLVKKKLLLNQPVIVSVDCFELPYRTDLFQKGVWPHSLLVCGYNSKKDSFLVIDQPEIDDLFFQKYEISTESLFNAIDCFHNRQKYDDKYSGDAIVSFNCEKKGKIYDNTYLINKWNQNILSKKDIIYSRINAAEKRFASIINQLSSIEYIEKYGQEIIDGLNDIVKQRRWENYLLESINDVRLIMHSELLAQWTEIRNKVALIVISKKVRLKTVERLRELAVTVFEMERKYTNYSWENLDENQY